MTHSRRSGPRPRRAGGAGTAALAAVILACAGCAPNTGGANEALGQNIVELGDAISALRQDNAALQEQIDSLRRQVARQDTVIRQLANLAGVPVPVP